MINGTDQMHMMDVFATCDYLIHILMKVDIVVLRFCGTASACRGTMIEGTKGEFWIGSSDL